MYAGGHLLTSALAGTKIWRKADLTFPTTIALMLAANVIDFDHLLRYKFDDGTANSLSLHWLHVNSGVIFLGLFALALLVPRWRSRALVLGTGLALHFSMDALAYVFNYNILILGGIDGVMLIVLLVVSFRSKLPVNRWQLALFYVVSWVFVNAVQAGNYKPEENGWIYSLSPAMLGVAALLFYLLFRKQASRKVE